MHGNKNTYGAVSVFLVIILVPCIVISSMFVDLGKVYLGKSLANSAGELALNTVMTNYDYDLSDYYGLVASCQNIEEFYEVSAQYYLDILNSHKLSEEDMTTLADYYAYLTQDNTIYDLLQIECQTAPSNMITTVKDGNLSNSALLKGQIVEFMKYRAPIELLEDTGILNSLKDVSNDLEDSKEDEKLLEDKRAFFEAENKLLEKAFNIYKDIQDYQALGATKQKLEEMAGRLNSYEEQYKQFHEALVKDLYNTAGLSVKKRTGFDINFYPCNTYYNNGSGDESLASISDVKTLMENLAGAITGFITAKESLEGRFPSYSPGSTYDIQWWVQCNGISLDDFNRKAEAMLRAYNALNNAISYMSEDAVTAYNNPDEKMVITGNDKSRYNGYNEQLSLQDHRNRLVNQVAGPSGLYSTYLANLVTDENSGDTFIKYMSIIERISTSADNQKAIDSARHIISASGVSASQTISDIYSNMQRDRGALESYRDALEKVIGQLDDLKTLVRTYKTKFEKWDETAKNTDTTLGDSDKDEIDGTGDFAGQEAIRDTLDDITEESVDELKTRLENIKELYDTLISSIDEMKYGKKKVKDIENFEAAKSASGISNSRIKQTNSELNSYVNESFKFSKYNNADVNILITENNNPNIEIEPRPALYVWMTKQGWKDKSKTEVENGKNDYEEKRKEADKDQSQQTVTSDSPKDILKDYGGSKDEFPSGLSMGAVNGGDYLSGIVNLAKDLFTDFNGAITGMRDNLYATEYMFGNFSFHTYEKEGKYKTAKEMAEKGELPGFSQDRINNLNYTNVNTLYENTTLKNKWADEDVTFWNNKSLTNKMINSTNNYAYGSEIEYILYGGKNDDNISKAYSSIYALRYVLNLPAGFLTFYPLQQPNGSAEIIATHATIHATSNLISAATYGIVPEPLVRIVLILIEVALETARDICYLKEGLPVKLIKGKADKNWGMYKVVEKQGIYFSYQDYLYVFTILAFNSQDKEACMYARIGDVIQANMRHIIGSGGSSYRLVKSVVYFQFQATLRVKPLMLALPIANGYENNPKDSTDWCTFTYKIIRGYT